MNRQGREHVRVWMMGAAALGILSWHQMAHAQTKLPFLPLAKKPAAKSNTLTVAEPPRLLPVPEAKAVSIQPVSQTQTVAASEATQKSEVMRQLELLYEKDGREMPDLEVIQAVPTNAAPATGTSSATPTTPQKSVQSQSPASGPALRTQTAPASSSMSNYGKPSPLRPAPSNAQPLPASPAEVQPEKPASKNPVVGFFKKLMPGNKEPKTTAAPPGYQPSVAPVPPGSNARPGQSPTGTGFSAPPNGQRQYAPFDATARSNNNSRALPALQQQPANLSNQTGPALSNSPSTPAVGASDIPPAPAFNEALRSPAAESTTVSLPSLSTQPSSAQPGNPELRSPSPADNKAGDFEDPFTEMSEEEADDEEDIDPYTGLTLEDEGIPGTPAAKTADLPNVAAPKDAAPTEDPFADELRKLGILPPAEAESPKLASTPAEPPSLDSIEDEATREKMKKIRERGGMKGLKGFCPVTLHDERELVDAKPDFHATYRGQKFHFASAEAKTNFEEDPSRYAPAAYGADVVALTRDKDVVEGSLDFAAWFKGRLYLFGTEEAHNTFVANPVQYATPAGIE